MSESGAGGPILETVGLHKSFGRLEVLRGIDLAVREGEVVALIGPSLSSHVHPPPIGTAEHDGRRA